MSRDEFRFFFPMRVRWNECDPQGIVFNASYLNYLEVGSQEYFHNLGFSIYTMPHHCGFDMVMAQASIQFKAPIRVDEIIELGVRVGDWGNSSFSFHCQVFQSGQPEPLAIIQARDVIVDTQSLRPIPVPQEFRTLAEHFETTGEVLPLDQFPTLWKARSQRYD